MANSIGFHGEDNGAEREPLSALAFCQVPPRHLWRFGGCYRAIIRQMPLS